MTSHARHVKDTGEFRRQIRFRRPDLLWEHEGPFRSPYAAEVLAMAEREQWTETPVTKVERLPIYVSAASGDKAAGPTVLDMMMRTQVTVANLPKEMADRVRAEAKAKGRRPPRIVSVYAKRDPETLWPTPEQVKRAYLIKKEKAAAKAAGEALTDEDEEDDIIRIDHPFVRSLASGGEPTGTAPDGWVQVEKPSSVNISTQALKLTTWLNGGIHDGYRSCCTIAAKAWEADNKRALVLWKMIEQAPLGLLLVDDDVRAVLPSGSISQEVERDLLEVVCADPRIGAANLKIDRGRGQPRKVTRLEVEADILKIVREEDDTLTGTIKVDYSGFAAGTRLADLGLRKDLLPLLGALRRDGHDQDCNLLEGFLDAADPDWRTAAEEEEAAARAAVAGVESPYDILGLKPDCTDAELAEAFRELHLLGQRRPNQALTRRVTDAWKAIKAEREGAKS